MSAAEHTHWITADGTGGGPSGRQPGGYARTLTHRQRHAEMEAEQMMGTGVHMFAQKTDRWMSITNRCQQQQQQ